MLDATYPEKKECVCVCVRERERERQTDSVWRGRENTDRKANGV